MPDNNGLVFDVYQGYVGPDFAVEVEVQGQDHLQRVVFSTQQECRYFAVAYLFGKGWVFDAACKLVKGELERAVYVLSDHA